MESQIHIAESIMVLINNLPIKERVKLHYLIRGVQTASSGMEEYQRFSGGWVCPICGGTHLQCNRKRKNETQKFIRKDCGMTFSNKMSTIFFGTRKTLYVWREYMNCLAEGLTIDQSAERCGITHYYTYGGKKCSRSNSSSFCPKATCSSSLLSIHTPVTPNGIGMQSLEELSATMYIISKDI